MSGEWVQKISDGIKQGEQGREGDLVSPFPAENTNMRCYSVLDTQARGVVRQGRAGFLVRGPRLIDQIRMIRVTSTDVRKDSARGKGGVLDPRRAPLRFAVERDQKSEERQSDRASEHLTTMEDGCPVLVGSAKLSDILDTQSLLRRHQT